MTLDSALPPHNPPPRPTQLWGSSLLCPALRDLQGPGGILHGELLCHPNIGLPRVGRALSDSPPSPSPAVAEAPPSQMAERPGARAGRSCVISADAVRPGAKDQRARPASRSPRTRAPPAGGRAPPQRAWLHPPAVLSAPSSLALPSVPQTHTGRPEPLAAQTSAPSAPRAIASQALVRMTAGAQVPVTC